MNKHLVQLVLVSAVAFLGTNPVMAQVPDPVVAAQAPTPGSGHNYIGLATETVNPADGSLTFDLPLPLPPGRGISLPFSIHYDSGLMYYLSPYKDLTSTFPALNWTLTPGSSAPFSIPFLSFQAQIKRAWYQATGQGQTATYHQCDWTTGFVFRGLDGVQYPLGQVGASWSDAASAPGDTPDPNCPYEPPAGGTFHGLLVAPGTQNPNQNYGQPAMTLTDHSGTTYSFAAVPIGQISSFVPFTEPELLFPQTITDRNGNQITLTVLGQHETGYIDTLGRTVVSWTYAESGSTIAVSGFGNVSISTTTSTGELTFPGTITSTTQTNQPCVKNSPQPNATTYTQSSVITLPNGETYSLTFDPSFGQINKIVFPGGGYVSYVWGTYASSSSGNASYSFSNDNVEYQESCTYVFDTPAITDRYVSYDGVHEALHQHFVYAPPSPNAASWTTKMTTVTTTDLTTGLVSTAKYSYGPMLADIYNTSSWLGAALPVETSIQYENSSGTVLETVNKTWGDVRHVIGEQTILSNGQGSAKQYCYDANEQLVGVYEYGFQSQGTKPADPSCYTSAFNLGGGAQGDPGLNNSAIGPLERRTAIALHNFVGASPSTHIVNEPDSVTVYDGSSNQLKQSSFVYDGSAILSSGLATKTGLVSPPGLRGNATSVTQWAKTGTSPVTTYAYYETGQMATKIDPCGNTTCSDMTGTTHTTTYAYSDSPSGGNAPGNSNAYLTQVTYPNTGVAHVESYQYNYPSGKVTQSTDQNKIVTNYAYDDPLGRLTLIDSAPGTINWSTNASAESKTAYSYPSPTEIEIAQDQVTTGDGVLKSSTILDGLGQRIKAVGRDGSVVETAYNGLGQVCAVSNPALAANAPASLSCTVGSNKAVAATDGYTYFTYDALGRKTIQTQPDSTTQQWVYTGNVVDFYDEDNSHWQWTSDALGRLTTAKENDPAGSGTLSLVTNYTYDPLDNLLSVNQIGASGDTPRYRTFAYDSMSRLTNACNPEAIASGGACTAASGPWSDVYTYDADGNVIKRTDARGIVTNYTYDALNRLLGKSYTSDPANTPTLTYGYDTEYSFQMVQDEDNPVGHLNSIMATLGTTNLVTWDSGDYDQRGNLVGYFNCLGSNAQSCPGFGVATLLGYDLNEDLTNDTENAGGATFNGQYDYISYGYDSAGRMNSIATYISIDNSGNSLVSTAFSGLTYYPGGAVETAKLAINPTTQVAGIALSRSYNNRGRITGEVDTNSLSQSAYTYSVSYDGNGNATAYNDSVAGNWTVKNDSLHRFLSSTGTYNGGASSFQETYDHFGNRNVEYFTYKGVQNQPSPYLNFTAANNRVATWTYDNAGNLLNDGTNNYLYDAEDRLCAVQQVAASGHMIGYVYAPDGTRLGKGNLSSFYCDLTKNGMLTANGLALTNAYVVGPQGEQLEVTDGNFNFLHFNVYWEGKPLGTFAGTTYAQSNWQFSLHDWLGTTRQVTNAAGTPSAAFFNGPFGDFQTESGSGSDPSGLHFTGQERDAESGLDYFNARYYSSYLGRFMSPDPLGGHMENPQSLNKYAYALNNPLTNTDPTGLDSYLQCTAAADGSNASTCQSQRVGGTDQNPQMATVQGVTGANGFTATRIGNNPDGSGGLVDLTTGTGSYTASVNGSGVQFSNDGGQTSSSGVYVNGTPNNTFQDAGFANGGALSGFTFTLTNSKMEANQAEAGTFTYAGTPEQAGQALLKAGFYIPLLGENIGQNEYRSPGSFWTGSNSTHVNVDQINLAPQGSVPMAGGDFHTGEHNLKNPIAAGFHCFSDHASVCP